MLPGADAVRGTGVTVAVVDTGVFYNDKVKDILGADLDDHFLGQIDFTRGGICLDGGDQYDTYCYVDDDKSRDHYGHGSHVAGIIWSQITDYATGVNMGIAPDANILSVRVLGEDGTGTYEDVIEGIQYVVENKDELQHPGHEPEPERLGHHPLLRRSAQPGRRAGLGQRHRGRGRGRQHRPRGRDHHRARQRPLRHHRRAPSTTSAPPATGPTTSCPAWSATGPTWDGFAKPDVLAPGANVISFMYNDAGDDVHSAQSGQQHPDYSETQSLFRMNGTSMATAVTSGVVALMLEAHPELTPDQVKFRLMYSARPALTDDTAIWSTTSSSRAWAASGPRTPCWGDLPADGRANAGMDIEADLAHGWAGPTTHRDDLVQWEELDPNELAYHYQGPVRRALSDDGSLSLLCGGRQRQSPRPGHGLVRRHGVERRDGLVRWYGVVRRLG